MEIKILNYQLASKFKLSEKIGVKKLEQAFNEVFKDIEGCINIVFVKKDLIKELNREFRDKNQFTDVLSFESVDDGIAEIYISHEVVLERVESSQNSFTDDELSDLFLKELMRMVVHGILHISGYTHHGYYTGPLNIETENSNYDTMHKEDEPMFKEQEKRLSQIIDLIK